MISWENAETPLLLNPRLPATDRARFEALLLAAPRLESHVWIASSGTSGVLKLVALSKAALLASAKAVNEHLRSSKSDVWCLALPEFHVGGLGIHARTWLSGARMVSLETWSPENFCFVCNANEVSLASLVPAQVNDLVRAGLRAPESLRAVVVGGAALSPDLYFKARALEWPLLPSFGMSECASQVATAALNAPFDRFPDLELLNHLEARVTPDGLLAFSGSSLLTGYALETPEGPRFIDPKVDGFFVSEDRGLVHGRRLEVHGRSSGFLKIGGESVSLVRLEQILDSVLRESAFEGDAVLIPMHDERLGRVIHLAASGSDATRLVEFFNARVLPFERIRRVHALAKIPRTSLGKVLRAELANQLE